MNSIEQVSATIINELYEIYKSYNCDVCRIMISSEKEHDFNKKCLLDATIYYVLYMETANSLGEVYSRNWFAKLNTTLGKLRLH